MGPNERRMKQADLFASDPPVIHYGPKPTPGLPNWRRVALCGVTYSTAGSDRDPPEPEGSSNLAHVTCERCLAAAGKVKTP